MTISTATSSIDPVVVVTTAAEDHHHHVAVTVEEGAFNDEEASTTATTTTTTSILHHLPNWVQDQRDSWGERLVVDEWQDDDGTYRNKHGWKGRDLIHDRDAPVRILDYYARYGNDDGSSSSSTSSTSSSRGGVGTTLTGIVHFSSRAESHQGYCHGGSMCSLMDDVIGWTAFLVTGTCRPWTGFTVQVNTALKRPIRVHSVLLIVAKITKVDRRKVSVQVTLLDPDNSSDDDVDNNAVHATGEGLAIINRGVLPEEETAT